MIASLEPDSLVITVDENNFENGFANNGMTNNGSDINANIGGESCLVLSLSDLLARQSADL